MDHDRWLGVELRHFAALQAVAKHGSFRGAAASLGYSQSAISQQMATLERLVGERLVNRTRGQRPVSLTRAGELLLGHAEAIVARLHAAEEDLATVSAPERTVLRIGVYQSVGARLLPKMLQRFRASGYEGAFDLATGLRDEDLLALLERDELDLTFATFPLPPGPLDGVELLRDRFVLLTHEGSPLAARSRPLTLARIAALPLIGYHPCRSVLPAESHLRAAGIQPDIVLRVNDNESVLALVAAGIGSALVPRLTLPANPEGVVVRELGELIMPRVLGLAWHRDRYHRPIERAFVRTVVEACATQPARSRVSQSDSDRGIEFISLTV